jgi:transcriptional regulator with XRE-family HTH domain
MPKEKPRVNIGEVIKTYRSQRGLSQGDIERRTGLLRCYLSRVENGHTVPSLETLAKIAEAMDISLADFFPGRKRRAIARRKKCSASSRKTKFASSAKSSASAPRYPTATSA